MRLGFFLAFWLCLMSMLYPDPKFLIFHFWYLTIQPDTINKIKHNGTKWMILISVLYQNASESHLLSSKKLENEAIPFDNFFNIQEIWISNSKVCEKHNLNFLTNTGWNLLKMYHYGLVLRPLSSLTKKHKRCSPLAE